MANKQARSTKKLVARHRARKPHPVRPLDEAKRDNHAARHEAKKSEVRREEARAAEAAEDAAIAAEYQELDDRDAATIRESAR